MPLKKIRFVAASETLDRALIVRLKACKIQPRFEAGMNNREASQAVNDALDAYVQCLQLAVDRARRPTS
jgi:hypothetical protein